MKTRRQHSNLQLQLGQETIYLIMATAVAAAVYFALQFMSAQDRNNYEAPIITLDEADGYSFATGSASISPEFRKQLLEIVVPKVAKEGRLSNATIVEVVGHTDEVPLRSSKRYGAN